MISRQEMMRCLNEVEERCDVASWTYAGIPLWPLVRIGLRHHLFPKRSSTPNTESLEMEVRSRRVGRDLARFVVAYLKDARHNQPLLAPSDALLMTPTISRQMRGAQGWYDKNGDPVVSQLIAHGKSVSVWEFTNNRDYRIPRYRASTLLQPYLYGAALLGRLRRIAMRDALQLADYQEFRARVKQNGVELDWRFEKALRQYAIAIRNYSDIFTYWLKRKQPRVVFVVCYYGVYSLALMHACQRLQIPTVDIQHGLLDALHPAYGGWHKMRGYSVLPRYFMVWQDEQAQVIQAWNRGIEAKHEVVVSGNMWLDVWRQKDAVTREYRQGIEAAKQKVEANKHILVTLQPGDDFEFHFGRLCEVIQSSPAAWFFWIRLHPNMMAKKPLIIQQLKERRIVRAEIELATELPLPAWLSQVDLHMTGYSTSVLEAEAFGVHSLLWHPYAPESFATQIKRGTASYVDGIEATVAALQEAPKVRAAARSHQDTSFVELLNRLKI